MRLNTVSSACCSNANNQRTGSGGKKADLFKSRQLEKVGDSCHKDRLSISVQAGGFTSEEEESGEGCGQTSTVYSNNHPRAGQGMLLFSWTVNKSPAAQVPESWSLLPLRLALVQQQLHENLQVIIYRNYVKRMVGWNIIIILSISENSLLLENPLQ